MMRIENKLDSVELGGGLLYKGFKCEILYYLAYLGASLLKVPANIKHTIYINITMYLANQNTWNVHKSQKRN